MATSHHSNDFENVGSKYLDDSVRLKSFCFPTDLPKETAYTKHNNHKFHHPCPQSVNSYLKSSYADQSMNSDTSNSLQSINETFDSIMNISDTVTSDYTDEEEKNLFHQLNSFSFSDVSDKEVTNDTKISSNTTNGKIFCGNSLISDFGRRTQIPEYPRTPSPISRQDDFEAYTPPSSCSFNRKRRISHRKNKAISISKPIDEIMLTSPLSMSSSLNLTDNNNYEYNTNYSHQASPIHTINDTNEQLKRNANGRFGSLIEFAEKNHINIEGRHFVDEPVAPKIDLSLH